MMAGQSCIASPSVFFTLCHARLSYGCSDCAGTPVKHIGTTIVRQSYLESKPFFHFMIIEPRYFLHEIGYNI